MRSFAATGVAVVSMGHSPDDPTCCFAAVYARGCAPMNVLRLTFLWIGVLFAPWVLAANPTPTNTAPVPPDAVRDFGRQWLKDNGGVGLSIGIYDGGQRRFYNFGSTQLE